MNTSKHENVWLKCSHVLFKPDMQKKPSYIPANPKIVRYLNYL